MNKKSVLLFALSIAILAAVFFSIDMSAVVRIISNADAGMIVLALVLMAFSQLFKILRWSVFVDEFDREISFWEKAYSFMASLFLSNVTPARVGEVSRPYFLKSRKIKKQELIPVIVVERFFDLFVLMIFSLFFLIINSMFSAMVELITVAVAAVLIVILVALASKKAAYFCIKSFCIVPFAKKFRKQAEKLADNFYAGIEKIREAAVLKALGLSLLVWASEVAIFYVGALSIGYDIPIILCAGFLSLSLLGSIISSLPGGLGSMEAICVGVMVLSGFSSSVALSIIILYRFTSFFSSMLLAFIFFAQEARRRR